MNLQGCKPPERMGVVGGSASASPYSSYQTSPCASYDPSPTSSSFPSPIRSKCPPNPNASADANSLIPWLKELSSGSSSASSMFPDNLFVHGGSTSAPVTPPLGSPTCQTPRDGPSSLTFSLIARNAFGSNEVSASGEGSRMWTPGQSTACLPAIPAWVNKDADVPMSDCTNIAEFAFRSNVKPWEGETIHKGSGSHELKLTLGSSSTR